MFKGIKLRTLLNTHQEWHAFVIGFFEVLCPWPPRHPIGARAPNPLEGEYHYYLAGRGLGFVALLLILIGFAKLVQTLWR